MLKKKKPSIDWDYATCLTYSTDYYERITLESWFTNLEQTALNRCQPLPAPYNQIAQQGFLIFNWLQLPLDPEDGFRTGRRNVSHQQQSFSGLQSPRWSFSIMLEKL